MESMIDELKEAIIREHPDGIWLVLAEEYPPDVVTLTICSAEGIWQR
jgi:hypothetical protein